MSRKVFLGRTRTLGSEEEEEVVQQKVMVEDDEIFINRMTGLNALWSDLLEQKKFNSILREQLQCSIKNQLILEATFNEREAQLQHEFDKIYATHKSMFSRNIEIGPVAANNTTTISGYQQEHVRQRQRCDNEVIRKVPSDNEQLHELPEHLRLPSEHVMQLESSPPKEQTRLEQNGASESNVSGSTTAYNQQNHFMELDADGALRTYQMEEVLTLPRIVSPTDNSEQSESVLRLDQCQDSSSYTSFNDARAELDEQSCPKKRFSRKSSLSTYLQIHSGEKPFKCADCDAAFNQSFNLARHRRTHSDARPFTCDVCKRSFRMKTTLSEHIHGDYVSPASLLMAESQSPR